MNLFEEASELFSFTQSIRRDLHQNPELGYKEFRTAGIVAHELTRLGFEVHSGIAETGVVALLEGNQPGPVVLLRFDMDALPIIEDTGAEYASTNPGVMHACGHDGHVAIGLTTARLLKKHQNEIHGTVKMVFQPAEEGLGGAERMLEAGVLTDPRPDACLALHLWNEKPVGWIGITPGPLMASADIFNIRLEGKGGHGAMPHQTVDPIAAAAQIISALQTIVARNLSPLQAGVVSVTTVKGGEAFNVIPQNCELTGTIRTFEPEVRELILKRFHEITAGIAGAMGCKVSVVITRLTPAVINDDKMARVVERAAKANYGQGHIEPNCRTMVSEDMSYLMQDVPGCYFLVGSANAEKGLIFGHHHPKFDIDEAALPIAATLISASALEFLSE
jgi:amidohydrolase